MENKEIRFRDVVFGSKNCKRCGVLFCEADASENDPDLCRCCVGKPPMEKRTHPASFWDDDSYAAEISLIAPEVIHQLPCRTLVKVNYEPNPDPDGWDCYTNIDVYFDFESDRLFFELFSHYPDPWDGFFYCESKSMLSLNVVKKYLHSIGCSLYDSLTDCTGSRIADPTAKQSGESSPQTAKPEPVLPKPFVIDDREWYKHSCSAFVMWNEKIIFRSGWFILMNRYGENSIISHHRAREAEEFFWSYQARMDKAVCGIPIETAYQNRGFTVTDNGFVYENYAVDGFISGSVAPITTVLEIPQSIDGIDINSVSAKAFFGEKEIEKVIFHHGIKTIGYSAFEGCVNLKEIEDLAEDAVIGKNAFKDTGCFPPG